MCALRICCLLLQAKSPAWLRLLDLLLKECSPKMDLKVSPAAAAAAAAAACAACAACAAAASARAVACDAASAAACGAASLA